MAFFFYFDIDHRLKIKTIAQRTFFRAEIQIFSPIFSLAGDRFSEDFSVFHPPTFLSMAYLRLLIFFLSFYLHRFLFHGFSVDFSHRRWGTIFSLLPRSAFFTSAHQTLVSPFPRAFIPLLFSGTKKCAPKYAFLLSYYFLFLEGGLYVVIRPLLAHAHFSANRADDGADDAG